MKNIKQQFYVVLVFAVVLLVTTLYACHHIPTSAELAANDIVEGKILAQKYCSNCHMLPDPSLVDKSTWESGVLPAMAQKMGLDQYEGQYFSNSKTGISPSEWARILAYYKSAAPIKLKFPKSAVTPVNNLGIFNVKAPKDPDLKKMALTTLVSFNPNDQKIYTADAANNLYRWNKTLNAEFLLKLPSPGTGVIFNKTNDGVNQGIFTCIGMLQPLDVVKGKVLAYNLGNKLTYTAPITLADSLPRPVQSVAADFNKDGLMDYAVCGFGHDRGGLYWLKQQPDHHFKTYPIRMVSGGTQLITGDFNNDGWADIMCLFAQADEGIWMFLNDHKGGFTSVNILRFPPIYGSSSFQLVDLNNDGKLDILYTSGDNSDYSRVLKPYHGVYIFLNDGNYHFKQKYFYHINGCTKAIAADFKRNGNMDIAAISFFPDFKSHPTEGFVFLEHIGPFQFLPHEFPINNYGRWLTMDVADYNSDGFLDIILGNFAISGGLVNQTGVKSSWDIHQPFIVLENNYKKKNN